MPRRPTKHEMTRVPPRLPRPASGTRSFPASGSASETIDPASAEQTQAAGFPARTSLARYENF